MKKTLEHQETTNVYIENVASEKQPFWRPINEIIENSYYEENIISNKCLNWCRNNTHEPQNILNEIKAALK